MAEQLISPAKQIQTWQQHITSTTLRVAAVSADPGHIQQVIFNLAVNARDAMSHGSRLTIRVKCVKYWMVRVWCNERKISFLKETYNVDTYKANSGSTCF